MGSTDLCNRLRSAGLSRFRRPDRNIGRRLDPYTSHRLGRSTFRPLGPCRDHRLDLKKGHPQVRRTVHPQDLKKARPLDPSKIGRAHV